MPFAECRLIQKIVYNPTWADGGGRPPKWTKKIEHPHGPFWTQPQGKEKGPQGFFQLKAKKIHFQYKINLKNTIFEHFRQKHSSLIVYSVFAAFVHQEGSLFYSEKVTLQSS